MCGDLEEEDRFESDLLQRFLVHAQAQLERPPAKAGDLNAYLDRLFADMLQRCLRDVQATDPSDAYERLAMQSLVAARLAGFLAGHVALNEDPMRKGVEALLHGYAEAEKTPERDHHHGAGHGHDHGHHHGHGQEHAHPHDHGHDQEPEHRHGH